MDACAVAQRSLRHHSSKTKGPRPKEVLTGSPTFLCTMCFRAYCGKRLPKAILKLLFTIAPQHSGFIPPLSIIRHTRDPSYLIPKGPDHHWPWGSPLPDLPFGLFRAKFLDSGCFIKPLAVHRKAQKTKKQQILGIVLRAL